MKLLNFKIQKSVIYPFLKHFPLSNSLLQDPGSEFGKKSLDGIWERENLTEKKKKKKSVTVRKEIYLPLKSRVVSRAEV